MTTIEKVDKKQKLHLIFVCAGCEKEFKSWAAIKAHLDYNPDHAAFGRGLVNVFRREL